MRWGEKLRLRIRMLFHRGQEVQRLDDEIHFHLEQQMAENISAGKKCVERIASGRHAAACLMMSFVFSF